MQLQTIFRMKLENFQSWDILKMLYVTLPPFKICKDSGLNLLENAHSSSPVEDPAGSVLDATKKGPDPNKRSNQLSVEMLNKRSKADFTVGIIFNFTDISEGTAFLLQLGYYIQ